MAVDSDGHGSVAARTAPDAPLSGSRNWACRPPSDRGVMATR